MTARRLKFDIRQAGRALAAVLAVWAVLDAGFYLLATRPKVREYTRLYVGTEPQRRALEERRREVEGLEAFVAALHKAETDLTHLRRDVLSTREKRMIEVQLELKKLADKFSIDLESIAFDNEILSEEELDKLVMQVPLEGGYANLRRFLQAVESSDKFLVVERVALGEGKEGGVLLQLNITLATYFDAPDERLRNEQRRRERAVRRMGRS